MNETKIINYRLRKSELLPSQNWEVLPYFREENFIHLSYQDDREHTSLRADIHTHIVDNTSTLLYNMYTL